MPDPRTPAKQRRILVVDDNVDAARSLQLLLSQLGHQVDVAFDGPAALHAARKAAPDIVLLDLTMPGMSGHDVARQLRQFLGSAVRLVALTGFGGEDDRRLAMEAGFDQHIVKPIDIAVLKSLTG